MFANPNFEAELVSKLRYPTECCYEVALTPPEEIEWDPSTEKTRSVSPCQSVESFESLASSEAQPVVAIIGCGYVGSHLAQNFGNHFRVIALDVSETRVQQLREDPSFPSQVTFTTDVNDLSEVSHFLIAVPTLLREDNTINDAHLKSAIQTVQKVASRGATVVIESSVAVGMTRTLLEPLMRELGLKGGMSPERVDPGRVSPPAHAIPKVVSGLDDISPGSLESVLQIYSQVFDTVVPVSRPEVAEMTKLFENCQRMVIAAYANEMSNACEQLNIDRYEVTAACATKPFGYLPFTPGLGVGGHCIPVNPHYLFSNCEFPLLRAATEATSARPASLAQHLIGRYNKRVANPKFLVLGVSFKPGQSSLVNSPALAFMKELSKETSVAFADPLVEQKDVPWAERLDHTVSWTSEELNKFDCIVLAVKQPGLDYELLEHVGWEEITVSSAR
ncbi:nucleotide sugar dehydrogenase [Westerdykella ornata]|uniref:Nucleotide sugar dehydrogenase n=1 Tax=Westerdykella ornata TaxID=318751 RepID=A0A6A6JB74_WESOR|nr:nucleotide sugar dehydrogenase [Westerdykella ornata]KAF2273517.1 nucleotide sugar dehydrogenase [Westerdykella ornata]